MTWDLGALVEIGLLVLIAAGLFWVTVAFMNWLFEDRE